MIKSERQRFPLKKKNKKTKKKTEIAEERHAPASIGKVQLHQQHFCLSK